MSIDLGRLDQRQLRPSLLFTMTLVGVPLSVEKEVSGQLIDGAVLLGRGAGRKWACEEEFDYAMYIFGDVITCT